MTRFRIFTMSITLPMMLKTAKPINNDNAVVTMIRECSLIQIRTADRALKEKSGISAGMESTKAMVMAPLMIPTTKAATIAHL